MSALAVLALLLASPQGTESDAFAAAFVLKTGGKPDKAAEAFEAIARDFPASPRVGEALVEAGVGWFSVGKAQQVLHRSPPQSVESFGRAFELFVRVATDRPNDPAAARAQYMQGSTHLFLGDLAAAEEAYGAVIAKHASDRKYFGKSLERRSAVRRHLLQRAIAIEDMVRHRRELGTTVDDAELVARCLKLASRLEKPAPALDVEAWLQGGPTTLDALRGQVIGLYFLATWCENCAKEQPFVLDLERRYGPSGLKLVGVFDHSRGQTADSVRKFLTENRISFPALMDRGKTTTAHLGQKIPDLVLIDRQGRVRWHDHPGALVDWTIEALLGEESASPPKPP